MKKKIIGYLLIMLSCVMLVGLLASCSFIENLLNGSEEVVAPTVTKAYLLKPELGYEQSKEFEYNKDSESAMPVLSGDKVLINIEYENPKAYSISYVKVNNQQIMANKFYEGSSEMKTIVEISASESGETSEESFTVNSIFYNTGTETKRVQFNEDYDMIFDLVLDPSYKLTIDFQNADERVATKTSAETSNKQIIKFGAELSNYSIVDPNYSSVVGLPEKPGGWVFEGYFTKPYGEGIQVSKDDKYYFWGDITVYAYYSRMYEYQIVDLQTAIGVDSLDYDYLQNGMAKTKIFKNGVIITKDTQKGHPIYDLGDTLVDEVLIKNEETGVITKKSTEYPIIGIANKAFQDINTMTNLIIGRFVREIGYCAFDNCNKLKKVDFNDNSELTTIGDFAFQDTKAMGITSPFTIPDKVTYLGNFAFRYSGWSNTTNNGINQSILHIKPNYNFIGVKCFFNTQFQSVIFEPGCHFDSQINAVDGHQLEVDAGWTIAHKDQNQIGANIFADCPKLNSVIFRNETEGVENTIVTPALNIIPDNAFDSGNYPLDNLSVLQFNEGVQYIGKEAFRYQDLITEITLPNSLEEVDVEAFYNCSNVLILNIGNEVYGLENSLLESLHTRAFANLINIDRVIINSKIFSRYGNGPFLGCSKLKSIEFPNITDISNVPRGYSELENPSEVQIGRVYSDFLYGTFETGEMGQDGTGEIDDTLPKTYSVPTRIFCNKGTGGEVLQRFKDNILAGKELKAGSTSSGTRNWRDTIFVYDIGLVFRNYSWEEGKSTDIALQEIYNFPDRTVVSYNLAFWSARTSEIKIPSSVILTINGDTKERIITELGMYCLPTCVTTVTIPASITRIEHDAFNNCSQLQTVTFEDKDTLEYIGENAFVGTKISSFTGGKNLQVVGQYAFWRCINLVWADFSQCTKITNKKSGSGYRGRISLKTQYKFEYELTAIDEADTDNDDAIDYIDAFHYGVFQACKSLAWVYLPPNIARMSRSLFEGCKDLRTVIIENDSISTETDYNDEDECCFYENNQPRTVYETTALDHTGEFIIYGINLDNHRFIFPNCTYEILYPDNPPSKP